MPSAQTLPISVTCVLDSADMALVPGGPFIYGIDKKQRDSLLDALSNAHLPLFDNESPKKTMALPPFYIDRYEVTNKQYAVFVGRTNHRKPLSWSSGQPKPDLPVVDIGWKDAEAYAAWAGKRLPIEEEWEKAARGTDGRFWPWGNEPLGENYNGKFKANYAPVKVGSFPSGASPYGAMDMAGNVYEMTSSLYQGNSHVMRGGCFLNGGAYTQTVFRWSAEDEVNGANWLGFRCACDTSGLAKKSIVPAR